MFFRNKHVSWTPRYICPEIFFFNWTAPDKSKTHLFFRKKNILENSNSLLVKTATDRKDKFGEELHITELYFTLLSQNLIWLASEFSCFAAQAWNWTQVPISGLDWRN